MLYLRQILAVLCLVLLAWSFLSLVTGPDIVSVLPAAGFLYIGLVSLPLPRNGESWFSVTDPSRFTISLRAPPLQ